MTRITIPANLTPAMLAGIACVLCGDERAPMVPVGHVDGGQVFACSVHVEDAPYTRGPALVLAPIDTPSQRKTARNFARTVATELYVPVTLAVDRNVNVTDFAAVYLPCTFFSSRRPMTDLTPLILIGEVMAAQLPIYERQPASENTECVCGMPQTVRTVMHNGAVWCASCFSDDFACNHCGESAFDVNTVVAERGSTFVPLCRPCVAGFRADGQPMRVAVSA